MPKHEQGYILLNNLGSNSGDKIWQLYEYRTSKIFIKKVYQKLLQFFFYFEKVIFKKSFQEVSRLIFTYFDSFAVK